MSFRNLYQKVTGLSSLYTWGIILMCLLILSSYLITLYKTEINPDATYYIGVSRLILEGKIPLADFCLHYTPLSFYLMCIPIAFFGSSYIAALSYMYLLHLINAGLVYKICRKESFSKKTAIVSALYCLLLFFLFDGNFYVLEPFVLFFGLSALNLCYHKSEWSQITVGLLCSFAFGSKQYGLGFVCLCMAFVLTKDCYSKKSILVCVKILIGFILGISLLVGFLVIQGVHISELVRFSGSDYHRVGITDLFYGSGQFVRTIPILLITTFIFCLNYKQLIKQPFFLVGMLGVGGFLLQCYVRNYSHYKLLAIPFAICVTLACIREVKNKEWNKYIMLIFVVLFLVPAILVIKKDIKYINSNVRAIQKEYATNFLKILPAESENTFVSYDLLPIAYITRYWPPLMKQYGLSNGFVDTKESLFDLYKAASTGIITNNNLEATKVKDPDIYEYIEQNFDREKIENNIDKSFNWVLIRR